MRKHYLDNLRSAAILCLFPYHTLMMRNDFGERFYVWCAADRTAGSLIVLSAPWLMPVLFTVAGMSARYSMQKRNASEFMGERIRRLLIPLISGMALLVPFQSLFARRLFYGYDGTVIEHYRYFFTHVSDLSGYDGMFTLGHLWFLLYLFLISIIALPIFKKVPPDALSRRTDRIGPTALLLLCVPVCLSHYICNFGGKSLGKYLLLYLAGYYLFSDSFVEKLVSVRRLILPLFAISQLALALLYYGYGFYGDIFVNVVCWLGVLSCLIVGRLFLDRKNALSEHLRRASFALYILHHTILVCVGYLCLALTDNAVLQMVLVMSLSFAATYICYLIIARIPILRTLAGIR